MGCCGTAMEAGPDFATLAGPLTPFVRWRGARFGVPSVGTVDTSAAPCCDACALKVAPVQAGCASGTCGPRTAGIELPVRVAGAVVSRRAAAALPVPGAAEATAHVWSALTGGGRQAGVVRATVNALLPIRATFRPTSAADLAAMTDLELYSRETDVRDIDFPAGTSAAVQALYRSELAATRAELDRRTLEDPDRVTDLSEDPPTAAEWERKRAEIARAAADRIAPGDTAADRERRDRIILQAVSSSFDTFNSWLRANERTEIEGINGTTSITLRRLENEDRAGERAFRLELARLNPGVYAPTGGGGGGGGGGGVVGLSLLGLALAFFR